MNPNEAIQGWPAVVLQYGSNILLAIFIVLAGRWLVSRAVLLFRRTAATQGLDPTATSFLANIVHVGLLVLVVIAALSKLGVPTASFIAAIGAAGLAIGLALQGSLSNFAAGVLLVTFKPCRVGDYIEGGGVAGTVQSISVFSTTLISPDRKTITVPNSVLLNDPIVNHSMSDIRRLDLTFRLHLDVDVEAATAVVLQVLSDDQRVLQDPEPAISVLAVNELALELGVRPWVDAEHYWALRSDLLQQLRRTLQDNGVEFAPPALSLVAGQ